MRFPYVAVVSVVPPRLRPSLRLPLHDTDTPMRFHFHFHVERSSSGGLAEEQLPHVWDRVGIAPQVENEPEERDAMAWLVDDEMMRQWEEGQQRGRGDYEATRGEGAPCTRTCGGANTHEEDGGRQKRSEAKKKKKKTRKREGGRGRPEVAVA